MKRSTYELLDEPRGATYRMLLSAALEHCDHLLLVVRRSIGLNASAALLLDRLGPLVISRREESEWPGTKLTDHTAQALRYRLTAQTTAILVDAAEGLFSWCQPERPEDPCFMRSDATPWLYTISHEREGFLSLDEHERQQFIRLMPELRLSSVRLH